MTKKRPTVPARYTPDTLDSDDDLGPAMRSLLPRQRGFVYAMFDIPQANADNSVYARAAGYEGSDNYIAVQAHRLAHNEKIQSAIREEAERRNTAILPWLQRRLETIAGVGQHKDTLAAVKHAQALAGLSPKTIHVVEHKTDRKSLLLEVSGALQLLQKLGVEVRNLLPGSDIIDIEAEDVTDETNSTEGLEEIL